MAADGLGHLGADARPVLPQLETSLQQGGDNLIYLAIPILLIDPENHAARKAIRNQLQNGNDETLRDILWELHSKPEVARVFLDDVQSLSHRSTLAKETQDLAAGFAENLQNPKN